MTIFGVSSKFAHALAFFLFPYFLENVTAKKVTFTRRLHVDIDAYASSKINITTGIAHQGNCGKLCSGEQCVAFAYNSAGGECTLYARDLCEVGRQTCEANDQDACSTERHATHFSSTMYFSKDLSSHTSLSSCADVPAIYCSGVYSLSTFEVYCDVDTAGGPWTVISDRFDGSVDFYRNWNDYKSGFGNLRGEFWLGFENVRTLLTPTTKLRIVMVGWDDTTKQVDYTAFSVGTEAQKYALSQTGFSSTDGLGDIMTGAKCRAGDAHSSGTPDLTFGVCEGNYMSYHNGRPFSTPDEDNDSFSGSCPESAHGSWWYGYCMDTNLFGEYLTSPSYSGMVWKYFYADGVKYSTVKEVKWMIKK